MLTINKVVIHELRKEPRANEAETFLSTSVLEISENVQDLIKRLNNSYSKDVINYAVFDAAEDRDFRDRYQTYSGSPKTNTQFLDFTSRTLNNLRGQIINVTLAKGGFFVYADYEDEGINYVGIYIVRDTEGMLFERDEDNHSFEVNLVKYMNTDKLAMGCRIEVAKYLSGDRNYLTLIKNRQSDISDYFYNWIGVVQPESTTQFTNALYEILNKIDCPVNPLTNTEYSIDEFRKLVVDYIKSSPTNTINLFELGRHFYENDQKIVEFARQNDIAIDTEFKADSKALKRFVSINVSADGINLKFSRGEFRRKVRLSEENPHVILIESERFANALKAELNNG